MNYWLFKTEPDDFSIKDLKESKVEPWSGVRNYQARNFLRDNIKKGDKVLIYHSNCKNIGIAGLAEVTKASYPDETQFNKKSPYYDERSTLESPRWYAVDIMWKRSFEEILSLVDIKKNNDLKNMYLVQKGSRLSVQPVEKAEFDHIIKIVSGSSDFSKPTD